MGSPIIGAMTKDQAIAWAGSQSELARRLGLDQSTVCGWRGAPPYVHQVRIQAMSDGELIAELPPAKARSAPAVADVKAG